MVNWGKRPEFSAANIPTWRKKLDWVLFATAATVSIYNGVYVALGLYYDEIGTCCLHYIPPTITRSR